MSLSSPVLKHVVIVSGVTVGALCLVVLAFSLFSYEFGQKYQARIYPGISIGPVDVGGLTREQAQTRLNQTITTALAQGVRFHVGDKTVTLGADQATSLFAYQVSPAVEQAYAYGRTGLFFRQALTRLTLTQHHHSVLLGYAFEGDKIKDYLSSSVTAFLPPAQDAQLVITSQDTTTTVRIQPEQNGQEIDWQPVATTLDREIATVQFPPIDVPLVTRTPQWKTDDVNRLIPQAQAWLAHAPFAVSAEGKSWSVTPGILGSWIGTTTTNNILSLELSTRRIQVTLDDWLKTVVQPAKDGVLVLENNKLKTFVAPEEGTAVDLEQTRQTILTGWEQSTTTFPITLVHVTPKIQGEDAERLGIREVIGIGRSNFSGSPSNRRYNIKLGAAHVNGTLLPPDGEFSMLKTLGTIDGKNGWLPELVIKGDKTTPEFGGGLCQIGTTAFRAAMNSGLLITERQNHSYRVRYYEPAGTDATIYDPAPDFKFKNDTANWVLLTAKVVGDEVIFTYWGTSDGRVGKIGPSQISNIVPPPPKKTIETTDLPPGKVKCTEVAHAGATARVDYTVTYGNGETKKVVFTSVYRPWGAVCLVGATNPAPAATGAVVDETGINNPN